MCCSVLPASCMLFSFPCCLRVALCCVQVVRCFLSHAVCVLLCFTRQSVALSHSSLCVAFWELEILISSTSSLYPLMLLCGVHRGTFLHTVYLTWYRKVSQDAERYHRIQKGITGCKKVSQDTERYHRKVSHDTERCHMIQKGITGCRKVSQGTERYHRIQKGITWYRKVSQDTERCHRRLFTEVQRHCINSW